MKMILLFLLEQAHIIIPFKLGLKKGKAELIGISLNWIYYRNWKLNSVLVFFLQNEQRQLFFHINVKFN